VKLAGVFRNIDFNSEANLGRTGQRNERLKHLLEDFADRRLDLRPSRVGNLDVIGNAYEYLIGRFASGAGKKAGEFYTPPEVSELLARLVDPQPGERICDPACGSGSLLIKCARQVGSENVALYGQENNGATWALAMMNMFLHNINSPRIEWGDTLKRPSLVEDDRLMHFDAAILLFRRQRPDTSVMFIDASREFGEGPNQNKLRPRDIQRIVETYRQRQNVDKYAYLASYDEIKANDFNLNIPRYVDTFIGETEVDVATVQVQIDALEQELNSVQQQLGGFLQELGYGE
jgi:type I restriction-modification system DNA methylase subunit